VIIVDNHSTDKTLEIATTYNAKIISFKGGRSEARNIGANNARGDYLFCIDSDMEITPNVVSECIEQTKKGFTAVIVPEISVGEGFWTKCRTLEKKCYFGDNLIEGARFFKMAIFKKIGGYDSELEAGEDWDITERIKLANFSIGRTVSSIKHLEGRLNLRETVLKKQYYGKTIRLYQQKYPLRSRKQLTIIRHSFIKNWRLLVTEPAYTAGMLIMKLCEFIAFKISYFSSKKYDTRFKIGDSFSKDNDSNIGLTNFLDRKFMGKIRYESLILIFILIIACSRILWFSGDTIITSGDLLIPTDSRNLINQKLYIWNEIDFGQQSMLLPRLISPMFLVLGGLNTLSVSNSLGLPIYTILMYILGTLAMYKLSKILLTEKGSNSIPLFASFFYLFNPVLINDGIHTSIRFLSAFVILPAMLYFFIRALRNHSIFDSFITAILITLLASDIPSFKYLIIGLSLLVAYSFFFVITSNKRRNWPVIIGLIFGLSILLNMFWLLPFFNFERLSIPLNMLTSTPSSFASHEFSTLLNVIRGFGKWSFFSSIEGLPYLAYSSFYMENTIVIAATIILPILVFSSIILHRNKTVIFLGCLSVFFIFMSKGINPPLGELYPLLINNVSIFKAVRESFYFLQALMIPYSILFGYACYSLIKLYSGKVLLKIRKQSFIDFRFIGGVFLIILLILPVILTSWPLITGDVITQWNDPDWNGVVLPDSYREVNDILKKNGPIRVLVLPQGTTYVTYEWGYSGGRNLLQYELEVPLVMDHPGDEYFSGAADDFVQFIYGLARGGNYEYLSKILAICGVEFVIVETGLSFELGKEADNYVVDLDNSPFFTKIFESNEIELFKVENSYPQVYVPESIVHYEVTPVLSNEIMKHNNLCSGWKGDSILEIEYDGSITNLIMVADGSYTTASKLIDLPFESSNQGYYVLLPFKTSSEASIIVAIKDDNGVDNYVYALNPTEKYVRNAYSSESLYELIFKIPEEIGGVDSIRIFATNFINKEYFGTLSFSFGAITIFDEMTFLEENLEKIELDYLGETLEKIKTGEIERNTLFGINNSLTFFGEVPELIVDNNTAIEFLKQNPTSYIVNVNSTENFVLILSQSYDDEWQALIESETVSKHFSINGYANAWIIDKSGSFQIMLRYCAQNDVEIGRFVTLITIFLIFSIFIFIKIKNSYFNSKERVTKLRNKKT